MKKEITNLGACYHNKLGKLGDNLAQTIAKLKARAAGSFKFTREKNGKLIIEGTGDAAKLLAVAVLFTVVSYTAVKMVEMLFLG